MHLGALESTKNITQGDTCGALTSTATQTAIQTDRGSANFTLCLSDCLLCAIYKMSPTDDVIVGSVFVGTRQASPLALPPRALRLLTGSLPLKLRPPDWSIADRRRIFSCLNDAIL